MAVKIAHKHEIKVAGATGLGAILGSAIATAASGGANPYWNIFLGGGVGALIGYFAGTEIVKA